MNIFDKLINIEETSDIGLVGLTDELFTVYLRKLFEKSNKNIIVICNSLFEANKLLNSLNNYTDVGLLFPMDDFLTGEAIVVSPDLQITRLETLNSIILNKKSIVITNLTGYLRFLPNRNTFKNSFIKLITGMIFEQNELIERLYNIGYKRETIVTRTGEIGVRGFVLDIFPIGEENPVRVEFFGDEIESIRYFDADDQKSMMEIKSIEIKPVDEFILDDYNDVVVRKQKYLPNHLDKVLNIGQFLSDEITIYRDYNQLKQSYIQLENEIMEYRNNKDKDFSDKYMFNFLDLNPFQKIYYMSVDNLVSGTSLKCVYDFKCQEINSFNENIEAINKYLLNNLNNSKTIIISLKEYQIKNFVKSLACSYIFTDVSNIISNKVNIVTFLMEKGLAVGDYIFLTEKELFNINTARRSYNTKFKYSSKINDINKLEIGDYVVHNVYGIGIYNGIKTLNQNDLVKDYLEIAYLGNDKLYIPVEKIDCISKYSAKEGVAKVNHLGGNDWQKRKARVRDRVKDVAKDLLALYAKREMQKGFMFSEDTTYQKDFEDSFSYIPTKDQLVATKQIKDDMESSHPMDRLLCGDVGFGKTEVAFRAMFKAVMDSKQVLYLCPTTILSNQQYVNAVSRFRDYPIRIGLLNRFTSARDRNRIIKELSEGKIDIVFGTHRILSNDIKPKDLGLLVIDEEQRFGVTHKMKIKQYKNNVDVLTLTATPIPRTLQMSMMGIRSLSLIETPPVNRFPVQTYVLEENMQIIKDAIYKELSRNGQVFLLYNSVERIQQKLKEISELVPEAKIIFAHGQMKKEELEDRMIDFINKKYDILLCTTIIETGIDIPNVNTLIILDADHFGLAQLYQIRGRVGRSDKIAYAYLMYSYKKQLNETSIKRLNAIKEFTELGSGFSIATRDLSIRGAGDILGSDQAGFIDTIGIDLYIKILEEEIARLKGEEVDISTEDNNKPLLNVETHISDKYVDDDDLKIEIHKKINEIDSYDKLLLIKGELEDRFGKIDEKILIYMYEEWFEKLAKISGVIECRQTKNSIEMIFNEETSKTINIELLFMESYKISNMFRFLVRNNKLIIVLDTINLEKHYIYYLIEIMNLIKKS